MIAIRRKPILGLAVKSGSYSTRILIDLKRKHQGDRHTSKSNLF